MKGFKEEAMKMAKWCKNTRVYLALWRKTAQNSEMRHHSLYNSTSCSISHGPSKWEITIFDPHSSDTPQQIFMKLEQRNPVTDLEPWDQSERQKQTRTTGLRLRLLDTF